MIIGLNLLYMIPGKVGGTETYADGIINTLINTDLNEEYYIFLNTSAYNKYRSSNPKIHFIRNPISGENRLARITYEQILFPFVLWWYKIDIVHSLGYFSPIFFTSRKIVTIHDLNWYYHPEDFNLLSLIIWRILVTLSARQSDIIITDSYASKKSICTVLKIEDNAVFVIYPGIDSIHHRKQDSVGRDNPKYIFSALSSYPHKNTITLIKAFEELCEHSEYKEYKLKITGLSGRDSSPLHNYILKHSLEDRVELLGWVSYRKLSSLYKNASLFVFPSKYEGFGFPILEAFANSIPVISSNAYSLSEVVGDAGILCDPQDKSCFSKKMRLVLSDKKLADQMARKGLQRMKIFQWHKTVKQLRDIYKKTLNNLS